MGVEERRERERLQRRQDILDAAKRLLVDESIQAATVNRIAEECELGVGTLYFYFKNKEEIFAALQEEGLEVLYDLVALKTDTADGPDDRLRNAALAYLEFSRDFKEYFEIINYFVTAPSTFFPAGLMARIHSKGSSVLSLIAAIVRQGIDGGHYSEPSPQRYAIFFWASLHGLLHIRKMKKATILENEDYDSFYRYSVDNLIQSIHKR